MNHNLAVENWEYYLGNHQQFFRGLQTSSSNSPCDRVAPELERLFRSYNICGEVVDHYVNSLVGNPFDWQIKDHKGSVCPPAEEIFSRWLDWQCQAALDLNLGDPLASVVAQMLVCDRGDGKGRGYLRLYSPDIFKGLEPYQRIIFHAPSINTVKAKRNLDGVLYQAEYGSDIYQLLNNGMARIANRERESFNDLDLGGRLPIVEFNGKALINDAIKRGQESVWNTLTYRNRSWDSANSPGVWIVNGQELKSADNSTTYIVGTPIGDRECPQDYADPVIVYDRLRSLKSFESALKLDVSTIYHQVGLAYLVVDRPQSISTSSMLVLRDDFVLRLGQYRKTIEANLRRIFSLVIKCLSDYYPVLKGCKPVVKLNLAVPASISERQENLEDVKVGALSIPTAIAERGGDVSTELELIDKYSSLVSRFR